MTPDEFFQTNHWIASSKCHNLMALQAYTGIGFDKEGAEALRDRISGLMLEIENEVEPKLPMRPLNKGELDYYRIPAKPFKMDGSLSSTMLKWMEKVGAELTMQHKDSDPTLSGYQSVIIGGQVFPVRGGEQTVTTGVMKMANQDDIKDFLIAEGWKPTLFNVKKDAKGKPVRNDKGNLIYTTPKMQEQGKLCPNLEALEGPMCKQICKWLSYRNRKSVIEGWLGNERLAFDGRLSAGSSGITPTQRQKHTCVVNVPKADPKVLLGKEMRSLFISKRPGYTLVGYDAAALEGRVEGHYVYPYEGGPEYAETLVNGDIHMRTVEMVYLDHVGHLMGTDRWHKDDPEITPWRNLAKGIFYGAGYGAQAKKIASMLGVSVEEGAEVLERYWEAAKPKAIFRDKITQLWETTGMKKRIPGIDGRWVFTRSKHSVVNTAFQSCGAIAMDYSILFMDRWLGGIKLDNDGYPCYSYKGHNVYRVGYFQDELIWEVPEHLATEFGELGVKSIEAAGRMLKMRVPLTGEAKQGSSWAKTH